MRIRLSVFLAWLWIGGLSGCAERALPPAMDFDSQRVETLRNEISEFEY